MKPSRKEGEVSQTLFFRCYQSMPMEGAEQIPRFASE
jgi:hypothetical protein